MIARTGLYNNNKQGNTPAGEQTSNTQGCATRTRQPASVFATPLRTTRHFANPGVARNAVNLTTDITGLGPVHCREFRNIAYVWPTSGSNETFSPQLAAKSQVIRRGVRLGSRRWVARSGKSFRQAVAP